MADEWNPCHACHGTGEVRVRGGHGDYDTVLCPECNPDPVKRMMGCPCETSGKVRRAAVPFVSGPGLVTADIEEATPIAAGRPLIAVPADPPVTYGRSLIQQVDDSIVESGLEAVGNLLAAERRDLANFVRAVLLYHSGVYWSGDRQTEYERLLGGKYASHTRGLCDAGRDLLARIGEGV